MNRIQEIIRRYHSTDTTLKIQNEFLQIESTDWYHEQSGAGHMEFTSFQISDSFRDLVQVVFKTEYGHNLPFSSIWKNYPSIIHKALDYVFNRYQIFLMNSCPVVEVIHFELKHQIHGKSIFSIDYVMI